MSVCPEGKFLIPMKDVADVQICENPFKTNCQPVAMHIRATQIKSCVYIQSKYKGAGLVQFSARSRDAVRLG